jgi:hypothetical protein
MWERLDFEQMTDDEKRIASRPIVPWVLIVVLMGAALVSAIIRQF